MGFRLNWDFNISIVVVRVNVGVRIRISGAVPARTCMSEFQKRRYRVIKFPCVLESRGPPTHSTVSFLFSRHSLRTTTELVFGSPELCRLEHENESLHLEDQVSCGVRKTPERLDKLAQGTQMPIMFAHTLHLHMVYETYGKE